MGISGYGEKESGKFIRLREICETIFEKREKVLVFTQFKELTQPLAEFLESIFQRDDLVLHDSIPVGKRKKTSNIIYRVHKDGIIRRAGRGINLGA